MRPIAVVTSCSAKGWHEYGRRFFETFCRHWPAEIALHVVSEDLTPADLGDLLGKDTGRPHAFSDLWGESPTARDFHERHKDSLRACGRAMVGGDVGWSEKKRAQGYNFRYDAYRFSRKVFAIDLVARRLNGGLLFWVDADVVTFADVPRDFLEWLLPRDKALCCLDRGEYHSECGFVGYNLDHDLGPVFIQEFARLYASDEVFRLREWHDSWVFDYLRRRICAPTKPIAHCSRKQPFINSKLGRYMDHLKGDSKMLGQSPKRHLVTNGDLPYWRKAV